MDKYEPCIMYVCMHLDVIINPFFVCIKKLIYFYVYGCFASVSIPVCSSCRGQKKESNPLVTKVIVSFPNPTECGN